MKTLFGLPREVKFCSKCVISNQRPNSSIEFKNKNQKKSASNLTKIIFVQLVIIMKLKKKLIGIKEIKCLKNFYQNTEKKWV